MKSLPPCFQSFKNVIQSKKAKEQTYIKRVHVLFCVTWANCQELFKKQRRRTKHIPIFANGQYISVPHFAIVGVYHNPFIGAAASNKIEICN